MKNIVLLVCLVIGLISCEQQARVYPYPCLDGTCNTEFAIDTISSPGAKLGSDGYWRVRYDGLQYFTIRGVVSELDPYYVINDVPLIQTKYDSDYWIVFDTLQFDTPMYSYLGWFNDQTLNNPIPIGNYTYTIRELNAMGNLFNLAGYEVTKHTCLDCPYSETLFGTKSNYNYHPTQNIFIDDEMVGDTASIFIQVLFNSDMGMSETRDIEMKIIFE